jgi:Ser/Thr protein kinase RdoA (MazF antagonist)
MGGMIRDVSSAFVEDVAVAFRLGTPGDITVEPMVGSANRLWRFSVRSQRFVVKELSHDAPGDLPRRRRAAAFERAVFESGLVPMPEAVLTADGDMIVRLRGSRGEVQAVRVHRWMDGAPTGLPSLDLAEAAGASLHTIQAQGEAWSVEPTGSIRRWDVEPLEVVDRLRPSSNAPLAREAAAIVSDALDVVAMVEQMEGPWIYSHCDHKPENALIVGGQPVVLDWDECGHCHPRLEAVEAALRWAGAPKPRRDAFVRFVAGYVDHGGALNQLSERDCGFSWRW